VVELRKCDDVVKELCELLGWGEELQKAWEETAGSVEAVEAESVPAPIPATAGLEATEKKVEKLAKALEKLMVADTEKRKSEEETRAKTEIAAAPATSKDPVIDSGAPIESPGPSQKSEVPPEKEGKDESTQEEAKDVGGKL
jgi:hypothetical protein